ncbi:MAG: type II toxin-antitoxin system VapC family toxin [Rubrivivax sp.]
MRLLLDTHVYLWVVMGSKRLTAAARRSIEAADQTFISAASIWEIGIKVRLGKVDADADDLVAAIEASGFTELPVRAAHAAAAAKLPLHHNDPFDRLLVAQALTEPLRLMSADAVLARYGDAVFLI